MCFLFPLFLATPPKTDAKTNFARLTELQPSLSVGFRKNIDANPRIYSQHQKCLRGVT